MLKVPSVARSFWMVAPMSTYPEKLLSDLTYKFPMASTNELMMLGLCVTLIPLMI